jgi:hypothetical protein
VFGFHKGKLRPSWRYSTKQVIWRVIPTGVGKLICEIRDLDQKRTRFLSINQTTGKVDWESGYGEEWWIGVETVHEGVLLLHKFASPDMPEHRSIVAAAIEDGRTIWKSDELRFEGVGGNGIYASVVDRMSTRYVEVDIHTGNERKEFDSFDAMRESSRASQNEPRAEMLYPSWKPDLQGTDSALREKLQRFFIMEKTVGPVEHIEDGDYLICSHHERSAQSSQGQSTFDTSMYVLKNDKLVFSEMLNRDAPRFAQGSFFVEDRTLFYIKDRSTLTAVRLRSTNDESTR